MYDTNNYATQLEYNLECKVQNKIESCYRPALVICCRLLRPPFLRNTGILSTFFLIQVVYELNLILRLDRVYID